MNWIEETLAKFGDDIGINDLGLSELPDGRRGLVLDFDDGERSVCLEQAQEDLLVYMTREFRHADEIDMTTALALGHFRNHRTGGVQAGLRGDRTLVFLTRIPARQVSQIKLGQSLDMLQEAHEHVVGR
ncbi:CesT family type III secretion system chaperone [Thalassospira sp. MA62]|nr:CesT family type III secretion system chaperone [Thalassospira sp. MA62]